MKVSNGGKIKELFYSGGVLNLPTEELDGICIPVLNGTSLLSGGKCTLPKSNGNTKNSGRGRCCIGALRKGGYVDYRGVEYCPQGIKVYNIVKQLAMDEISAYPIQKKGGNGISDFSDYDIYKIIYISSKLQHNSISFVDDSLQLQGWQGFECELIRRVFNDVHWYNVEWNVCNKTEWKYGIKLVNILKITVPDWIANYDNHTANAVDICHFNHYRPYINMKEHRVDARMSDIMKDDWGLHF